MARYKNCIMNPQKACNDCGECDICDLNPNKKCNNCGKCLEMEGFDMKAINIDEIIDDEEFLEAKGEDSKNNCIEPDKNKSLNEKSNCDGSKTNEINIDEDNIELIDDIDGLREILEDESESSKLTEEEFPGLIRFIGKRRS